MQIILASAKIMNDRSATKGDACQSKKVKSSPDISLSSPRFQNEARNARKRREEIPPSGADIRD